MQMIALGDESAFRQIFERYNSRLVSYHTTFTKSREEAKELTQDVFVKIWMNREKLSAIEFPEKYIFTIARNSALDFLRRASVDSKMRESIWENLSEYQDLGEEQVSIDDRTGRIREAMHKLSRQRQVVFRLSRIDGLTHDQIALRLSISKNTVKNHVIASVKFIKNYVSHHYEGLAPGRYKR